MKKKSAFSRILSFLLTLGLIIILILVWDAYQTNNFNEFIKAMRYTTKGITTFSRDKTVEYEDGKKSYKIESNDFNDAIFYKEIKVEPNTQYKISCMVKTNYVENNKEISDSGAIISIYETTEVSKALTGTNDWTKIEMYINSENRTTIPIGFRLGGNLAETKGTAWFADIKVEKGMKIESTNWKVGCYIFNINTEQYQIVTTTNDRANTKMNMERFATSCKELSKGKMTVTYEIKEIDEPVTTLTNTKEFGDTISPQDVQNIIGDDVINSEYDYVFIIARMETPQGVNITQNDVDWLGLGKMDLYGIGFSNIRISETYNDVYNGISNRFPEEVYIHEFLHTLERNLEERNYTIPELHSYETYGYKSEYADSLKKWYADYMNKNISDKTTNSLIGLDEVVYTTQPAHKSDFDYGIKIEFESEPKNIIEDIRQLFNIIGNYFKK